MESVIFLFTLGNGLAGVNAHALIYQKCCYQFLPTTTCSNMSNLTREEIDLIQPSASYWMLYQGYVQFLPTFIMTIYAGAVSDNTSTRRALLMPCFGQILRSGSLLLNALFLEGHPALMLIPPLFTGVTGGHPTLKLAALSYISNNSSHKSKSTRLLMANGMFILGRALSNALGGIQYDKAHKGSTFLQALVLSTAVFICVYCYIDETRQDKRRQGVEVSPSQSGDERNERGGTDGGVLSKMKHSAGCVMRKRPGNIRSMIIMIIIMKMITSITTKGTHKITYLYLRRPPLSWSQTVVGFYRGFIHVVQALSTMLIIPTLRKRLQVPDSVLLLIGLSASMFSDFFFSLSSQTWMVFAAGSLGLLAQGRFMYVAVLCSLVEPHETGGVLSFLGAANSLSEIFGSSMFNILYVMTLPVWPTFPFLLSAAIGAIPVIMAIWFHMRLTNHQSEGPSHDRYNHAIVVN